MTSDRQSNIVSNLINKANSLEHERNMRKTFFNIRADKYKKKKDKKKEDEACFSNTIDLVFTARKEALKNKPSP